MPNMAVYSATKSAVRAISEGMRQEGGRTDRMVSLMRAIFRVTPSFSGDPDSAKG